ncbi:MAG: DnaJ C-terminal domain-containing protein [Nitrospirales bacterium]
MANAQRDWYDVLGVARTATQGEIKKAYRRLARRYHPDLHTGPNKAEMEAKFKELNEAHEVLGNPDTRKKYDQFGHQWREAEASQRAREEAASRGGATDFHWEAKPDFTAGNAEDVREFFEQVFGAHSGTGTSFRGFLMPGADLETSVSLTLREVLAGTTRRLRLQEPVRCEPCQGTGRRQGRRCAACGGIGSRMDPKTIEVRIPGGVAEGTRLRVPGKGAPGVGGGPRGDLYLLIHLEPHPVFHRDGHDLVATLPVWPWEAALGAEVVAPTLTDTVRVKIPAGSRSGSKLRLKGKGLPRPSGGRGDLLYTLNITIPETMSSEERRLYEQLGKGSHPDPRESLLKKAGHE